MTQREIDTIDIRADREILGLICSEVFLRRLKGKRIPKRLEKRQRECIIRFLDHFEGEETACVKFDFNRLGNGAPDFGNLELTVSVLTRSEMEERNHMAMNGYDDEEDDEDDE